MRWNRCRGPEHNRTKPWQVSFAEKAPTNLARVKIVHGRQRAKLGSHLNKFAARIVIFCHQMRAGFPQHHRSDSGTKHARFPEHEAVQATQTVPGDPDTLWHRSVGSLLSSPLRYRMAARRHWRNRFPGRLLDADALGCLTRLSLPTISPIDPMDRGALG